MANCNYNEIFKFLPHLGPNTNVFTETLLSTS